MMYGPTFIVLRGEKKNNGKGKEEGEKRKEDGKAGMEESTFVSLATAGEEGGIGLLDDIFDLSFQVFQVFFWP